MVRNFRFVIGLVLKGSHFRMMLIGAYSDTFELVVFRRTIMWTQRDTAMIRGNAAGEISSTARLNGTPISILADISKLTRGRIFQNAIRAVYSTCIMSFFPFPFPFGRSCRSSFVRRTAKWHARRLGWRMSHDYAASRFKISAVTSGCYMHAGYRRGHRWAINIYDYHLCAATAPRPRFCPLLRNVARSIRTIKTSHDGTFIAIIIIDVKRPC